MCSIGDHEIRADLDAAGLEAFHLLDQLLGVDHDAVADDAGLVGIEDPAGDQVQRVALVAHHDRVAGVGTAVVAHDDVVAGGEDIDDLALALVAPLETDDGGGMRCVVHEAWDANGAWG